MLAKSLLSRILHDEAVTRGLADPEARVLVEWLVERAEDAAAAGPENTVPARLQWLCRRGRALGRFVYLWCYRREPGAAGQLAVAERFAWPLPEARVDPCQLMLDILDWETDQWFAGVSPKAC